MQLELTDIAEITHARPEADHSVEQYLMKSESLLSQATGLATNLESSSKILFLGDDDHLSIALARQLDAQLTILELDDRVRASLTRFKVRYALENVAVVAHDLRYELPTTYRERFDYCILNPPYSSKNKGFGITVWIARALSALRIGGKGILTIPLQDSLPWSLDNMVVVQRFLSEAGVAIITVDKDLHTYEDLPDKSLLSSNIWFEKYQPVDMSGSVFHDIPQSKSLYR